MIEKTNVQVNIEELKKDFLKHFDQWPVVENRVCLNNYIDRDDYSKNASIRLIYAEHLYMNSIFKNTIWEETLMKLPGKIGRARIMIMNPGKGLDQHRDLEMRWHLALFTDPGCIAYDVESDTQYHIPADGYFYKLDARKLHRVYNESNIRRVHLVVSEYV